MYEAWNQTSLRARVALAHKARLFIGIAALVAISTVSEAADGCGRGMFYNGRRCVPQDGPGYGPLHTNGVTVRRVRARLWPARRARTEFPD